MAETMLFTTRDEFRRWLEGHWASKDGIWLQLSKPGGPKTITAKEALEEALCFGWIDGKMQRVDEKTYVKYVSPRRENSPWSERNKTLAEALERQGRMTDHGRAKIGEAKRNGQWSAPKTPAVTEEQLAFLADLLSGYEPACTNYQAMPPSVKKTYVRAYFDAKTEAGRAKRLAWMVGRLNDNRRPM